MGLSSNFRMLAVYNQRMNDQLLKVCEKLSSDQLHQETGSFFSSVMSYWNHLLFGDLIMLQRLIATDLACIDTRILESLPIAKSVNDTFVSSLEELKELRSRVDDIYIQITQEFEEGDCERIVRYITTEGTKIERNVGEFCQHIFNHQTHHRGQLTCILSQFGLDFGCTDLPVIVPEGGRI